MKNPCIIMRGAPVGGFYYMVTNSKGERELQSRMYETEEECIEAAGRAAHLVKSAADEIVNQLPSEIAHK